VCPGPEGPGALCLCVDLLASKSDHSTWMVSTVQLIPLAKGWNHFMNTIFTRRDDAPFCLYNGTKHVCIPLFVSPAS